jgi:signal transduction histidine kinase
VVLIAFAVTLGWSFQALSEAARDATLIREAYLPLVTSIGEALAGQNVMAVQLNHITAAKNPADVRQWIETARRLRPASFQRIEDDARALSRLRDTSDLRSEVERELASIASGLRADDEMFAKLFSALAAGDGALAERHRDQLVTSESEGANRLRNLRQRVEERMRALTEMAEKREKSSVQVLLIFTVVTLLVGLLMSIHARRVLAPLALVTARTRMVAAGDLSPSAIVTTDDEIGELAKTFEDMVQAIKKARAELVQAERLATIGKMAAHITHEVRNPLSSISLNLELLQEELQAAGPDAVQLGSAIRVEVERLSQIAEQYLAAAREPRLRTLRENLADVVRDCHAFMRPELARAGVSSRVEIDDEIDALDLDEAQFRQALVNLIRNAREALDGKGELVLRVSQQGDVAEVVVEDDGPGILEDVRPHIFDPFYTTKQRGTGLGLAVTRAIIEAHGGTIACEGRGGGGTRFSIRLPITSPAASAARPRESRPT